MTYEIEDVPRQMCVSQALKGDAPRLTAYSIIHEHVTSGYSVRFDFVMGGGPDAFKGSPLGF